MMEFSEEFLKYLLEKGYPEGYAKHMACWAEKRVAEKRKRRDESIEEKKKRRLGKAECGFPEDMLSNIPDDILQNILKRLPTKSLACFKLVCRRWRFLISDPQFARLHLNHGDHPVSPVWVLKSRALPLRYLDTSDLSSLSYRRLFKRYSNPIAVYNSCDGIICLYIRGLGLKLWNPCTNECDGIPIPSLFSGMNEKCGFGYDSCNKVYKCVRVPSAERPLYRAVEVLTLNLSSSSSATTTNSSNEPIWRRIYDEFPMTFSGAAVPFDGGLYWIGFNPGASIQRFDLAEERFQEVPLPFNYPTARVSSFDLGVLRTHLAVFHGKGSHHGRLSTDIWIMNKAATPTDTTWIKAYRIPKIRHVINREYFISGKRVFVSRTIRVRQKNYFLTQKGEIVIYGDDATRDICVIYNPATNDFKIEIDYEATLPEGKPFLHVPSLISPSVAAEH